MFVVLVVPLLHTQDSRRSAASSSPEITRGDWASYNRDYNGDRYSPLNEITVDNVARLAPICAYDSGVKTSFETGPVVVGGTLYFTTLDTTFAVDDNSCTLRWKHTEPLTQAQWAGLGVNRGVAAAEGDWRMLCTGAQPLCY